MTPERSWSAYSSTVVIWLDAWEWQCCGDLFAVGDVVELNLFPAGRLDDDSQFAGALGPTFASALSHFETHHGQPSDACVPELTRVRVKSITAAHWRYGINASNEALRPVPGSASFAERVELTRWEDDSEDGRRFAGWLIEAAELS